MKYWETMVLSHFFIKPEENRYRDYECGKLHIPHISGGMFTLGVIVKEYKVCCDLLLRTSYS